LQKHTPPPWPTRNLPKAPRAIGANNVVAPIDSRANHHGGVKKNTAIQGQEMKKSAGWNLFQIEVVKHLEF